MYTAADNRRKVYILYDWGANAYMTPFISDTINKHIINRNCTLVYQTQLIQVKLRGKDDQGCVVGSRNTLPTLEYGGKIRRNDGEFVNSISKPSYI